MTYNIGSSAVELAVPVPDLFLKIGACRPCATKQCRKVSVTAIKMSEYYQK